MAKIEQDFIAARGEQQGGATPPFLPRKPIPRIGLNRIDGERFYSREFADREWRHIWTRTWNVGVHLSELPDPGSFRVHTLGKESLLFVRGEDGRVRGFFNVCQHRGNILCQTTQGDAKAFRCPYHGWEWHLDGSLKCISHPNLFPQYADGVPPGELDLPELRVDTWGGWVWFNMDPHCVPLRTYLGEAGRHLEVYELEKFQLIDHKSFEWHGNWKHAHDAFNESYHFEALHPEFLNITEGYDIPIELLGIHSRMLNFNNTVSELLSNGDEMTPFRKQMLELVPTLPRDWSGSPREAHLELVKRKRAIQDSSHLPYKRMSDEQLVHQYHYTFFPGTTFTSVPEASIIFRYRPHESDPNYCYYDFLITAHNPPGTPAPEVHHRLYRHHELPDYAAAFEGTFHPVLANVLKQDGSNMPTMQQGVQSEGFRGMILCDQEVRIRHFHQTIDRYLIGDVPQELRSGQSGKK